MNLRSSVLGLALLASVVLGEDGPVVKINQGELKGSYLKSRDGKTYSAFRGVPYANKPEKFEMSKLASKWSGIRDATKYGSVCPQISLWTQKFDGNEDCLFVNVFTPDAKGNLSVLVFIHGGGFYFGNSDENGADYFMDEEVVFITLNYRIAAPGFLSTGDEIIPGNLGLKDQQLGLKWVQQNVKYFGGDPSRVTIFGESAGAASVSYHVLSPTSEGLFRSAICQSGSSLNPWAYVANPKVLAEKFAKKLGCPTDTSSALKKCLKSKTIEEIISVNLLESPLDNPVTFGPTSEPKSVHAFITESPEESYKKGRFAKVPMIMTVIEKEGILFHAGLIVKDEALSKKVNENWIKMAPSMLMYDHEDVPQEAKDTVSKRIRKFYFGDEPISLKTFDNLTNVYSDQYFIHGVRKHALHHAKHAPVYTVVLAYPNAVWSHAQFLGFEEKLGMTHADDLPFFFSADKYPKFEPRSEPELASKLFVKTWATFADQGDPNFQREGAVWTPVGKNEIDTGTLSWLWVERFPTKVSKPLKDRMELWDKVYKKLRAGSKDSKGKDEL